MPETVQVPIEVRLKGILRRGINLQSEGKTDEALSYWLAVRDCFSEAEPEQLRHYHNNLGIAYFDKGEYERAARGFERALSIEVEGMESDEAAYNANLAIALLMMDRTQEASAYLAQPEEYFRRTFQHAHLGDVLDTKARIHLARHEYKLAEEAARQAVDTLLDCGDLHPASRAIRTLGMAVEAQIRNQVEAMKN